MTKRTITWAELLICSFWWMHSSHSPTHWASIYELDIWERKRAPAILQIPGEVQARGVPPFMYSRGRYREPEEILWNDAFVKLAAYVDKFGAFPPDALIEYIFKEVLEFPNSRLLVKSQNRKKIA